MVTRWSPEELADMAQYDAQIDATDKPNISLEMDSKTPEYHKAYNRLYYLHRRDELLDKAKENYKKTAQLVRQSSGAKEN